MAQLLWLVLFTFSSHPICEEKVEHAKTVNNFLSLLYKRNYMLSWKSKSSLNTHTHTHNCDSENDVVGIERVGFDTQLGWYLFIQKKKRDEGFQFTHKKIIILEKGPPSFAWWNLHKLNVVRKKKKKKKRCVLLLNTRAEATRVVCVCVWQPRAYLSRQLRGGDIYIHRREKLKSFVVDKRRKKTKNCVTII